MIWTSSAAAPRSLYMIQKQLAETELGIDMRTHDRFLHQDTDNLAETQAGETQEDKYLFHHSPAA